MIEDPLVSATRQAAIRSRPTAVFAVTALGAFMVALDLSVVNVAFPALQRDFPDSGNAWLAWVITGYSIVFGSLLVTGGRTADRIGRRRVFFVGLGIFTLGSVLCGLAPSVLLLVAGRVTQGVGGAFALPASLGLLLHAFPAERRSQVVALWGGVGALAVATGPSLGAVLISVGGWRWAFYINLPVAAVAWLWGRRVLDESRQPSGPGAPDYLGVLLISTGLALLVLAISQGPAWGWTDPRTIGAEVVAAGLGAVFVYRCAHHPEPVLDLSLFAARSFTVANIATLLYAMGFFAMLLGNILFLTGVWNYSILRAGLAVTPGPLVVALVAGFAGKVAGRIGFRPVLLVGSAVFAVGLAWFATRVGIEPAYLAEWLPGTIIIGLGIGLTFPVLSAAAVSSLPQARLAVGSAVNQTARQIGGAIGIAILVAILGTPTEPNDPIESLRHFRHLWLYCSAMAAASGLVALMLRPLRPAEAEATDEIAIQLPAGEASLPLAVEQARG